MNDSTKQMILNYFKRMREEGEMILDALESEESGCKMPPILCLMFGHPIYEQCRTCQGILACKATCKATSKQSEEEQFKVGDYVKLGIWRTRGDGNPLGIISDIRGVWKDVDLLNGESISTIHDLKKISEEEYLEAWRKQLKEHDLVKASADGIVGQLKIFNRGDMEYEIWGPNQISCLVLQHKSSLFPPTPEEIESYKKKGEDKYICLEKMVHNCKLDCPCAKPHIKSPECGVRMCDEVKRDVKCIPTGMTLEEIDNMIHADARENMKKKEKENLIVIDDTDSYYNHFLDIDCPECDVHFKVFVKTSTHAEVRYYPHKDNLPRPTGVPIKENDKKPVCVNCERIELSHNENYSGPLGMMRIDKGKMYCWDCGKELTEPLRYLTTKANLKSKSKSKSKSPPENTSKKTVKQSIKGKKVHMAYGEYSNPFCLNPLTIPNGARDMTKDSKRVTCEHCKKKLAKEKKK